MIEKTDIEKLKSCSPSSLRLELINACIDGDLEKLKYICFSEELPINILPGLAYEYGLRLACGNGHMNIIKYLLEDLNFKEIRLDKNKFNECLIEAGTKGQIDVIKYFLADKLYQTYLDINYQKSLIIKKLCEYIQVDIIKYMLSQPFISNTIDITKKEILECIFKTKNHEIINCLVFSRKEINEVEIEKYMMLDEDLQKIYLNKKLKMITPNHVLKNVLIKI